MMKGKSQFGLIFVALSTKVAAAPIAPPAPAISVGINAYARAVTAKDSSSYGLLLASNVKITNGSGVTVTRTAWMQLVGKEFSHATRRVVVNIFAGPAARDAGEQVSFIEEVSECPPAISECSPHWQIETLTLMDMERQYRLTVQAITCLI